MTSNIDYNITKTEKAQIWSLEYLKNYLRVAHDYDDPIILEMLDVAIEVAESITGKFIHRRFVEINITDYRGGIVLFKYTPFMKINEAVSNGHPIAVEDIIIREQQNNLKLAEKYRNKHIKITYVAGFGDKIPKLMQMGLLMYLERLYERGVDGNYLDLEINRYFLPFRKLKV